MAKTKIVEAIGVSTKMKGALTSPVAQKIEEAMQAEILKMTEEGIAVTEENAPLFRERMQAARQRILDEN